MSWRAEEHCLVIQHNAYFIYIFIFKVPPAWTETSEQYTIILNNIIPKEI